MILYAIIDPMSQSGNCTYYETRASAITEARQLTADPNYPEDTIIEVERVELVKLTKTALVQLLNQEGGYVNDSKVVARVANGQIMRGKT